MKEVTGVILAGGKSSRMNFNNKAFALINGQKIIEIILSKFFSYFDETIIISNEPLLYSSLNVPVYTDIYPRLGPMSGIHSGLTYAKHDASFVLACDMPFIPVEMIDYMLERINGYDAVVPEIDGFLHMTAAVYRKSSLPVLTENLQHKKLKMSLLFKELNALALDEEELKRFGDKTEMFHNINCEEDLIKAEKIAGRLLL
ncbi:molybdenum cofactor guanylyltransferase [Thermosyntropha sp.]|uniref:molybdenum cofactor guanylyltransferase n=1 Tax=Thermosyntropha sp. TaxID=2740820 RepID=UPI0025FCA010|nr:molybdenum cofactor guanylyltransferase [Thermosyntropha sp.]MBO8159551.1 molybdenum cofactor guanylyltransferase [Thermosyntropha sp.]